MSLDREDFESVLSYLIRNVSVARRLGLNCRPVFWLLSTVVTQNETLEVQ